MGSLGTSTQLLLPLVFFALLYFLMIAPNQKKAAAPKYSPPKYDSARIAGCRKRQTLYEKRLRSGQTRLIEGGSDCHSHRR